MPKHLKNPKRVVRTSKYDPPGSHLAYEMCFIHVYEGLHQTILGNCTKPKDHDGVHSHLWKPSPYLDRPAN